MKTLCALSAGLAAVVLLTGPSAGQNQIQVKKIQVQKKIQIQPKQIQVQPGLVAPAARDNKLTLLADKGVQEDLKLTAEQVKTVKELSDKYNEATKNLKGREAFQKSRELIQENAKAIDKLLDPNQDKRLGQLEVQQKGPNALVDPKVAGDLGLTQEQRTQAQQAIRESARKRGELAREFKGDATKIQEKVAELNKTVVADIVKGLTEDQKTKWKNVTGEPFKGTLPAAGGFAGVIRPLPGGGINPVPIQPKLPIQRNQ